MTRHQEHGYFFGNVIVTWGLFFLFFLKYFLWNNYFIKFFSSCSSCSNILCSSIQQLSSENEMNEDELASCSWDFFFVHFFLILLLHLYMLQQSSLYQKSLVCLLCNLMIHCKFEACGTFISQTYICGSIIIAMHCLLQGMHSGTRTLWVSSFSKFYSTLEYCGWEDCKNRHY